MIYYVLMNTEQLLNVVMKLGTLLMASGAEVYRVEETMNRICLSFPDVESVQSYGTVTGIMLSITVEGKTYTHIGRVRERSTNLAVIDEINELSRQCCRQHMTVSDIEQHLYQIEHTKRYSFWTTTLFGAIGAFGFSIFFDGNIPEMIASFVIGIVIRCMGSALSKLHLQDFLINMFSAMMAAWLAVAIHALIPQANINIMVISSIMLLVPGLAFTNSIRDTISTDYVSGVARGAEAFLCATAIAIGAGFILYIWR